MFKCSNCKREFQMDYNDCPVCRRGLLVPIAEKVRPPDPPAFGPPPTNSTNYKKRRAEEKKKKTDELLAAAKQEVRRLEKGIDKVLFALGHENTLNEDVIKAITNDLIELYNGKEI